MSTSTLPHLDSSLGPMEADTGPFNSLDFFRETDSEKFGGRDDPIRDVVAQITSRSTFVLYGRSGLGKTSLLLAGVFPELRKRGFQPIYVRTRNNPARDFAAELFRIANPNASRRYDTQFHLDSTLEHERQTLIDDVIHQLRVLCEEGSVVIAFDQFEEFFIRFRKQPEKQRLFRQLIAAVLEDRTLDVRVVFSLREDYFAELDNFRNVIPNLFENEYRLTALTAYGTRDTIRRHLDISGLPYDRRLLVRMVDHLAEVKFDPTLLQIACVQLYRQAKSRKSGPPRFEAGDVEKLGGWEGIFSKYLSDIINEIPKDQHLLLRTMLDELISDEQTKQAVTLGELLDGDFNADHKEVNKLLTLLVQHRLLRAEKREEEIWYELIHERLVAVVSNWLQLDDKFFQFRLAKEIVKNAAKQEKADETNLNFLLTEGQLDSVIGPYKHHLRCDDDRLRCLAKSASYCKSKDAVYWIERYGVDVFIPILGAQLESSNDKLRSSAVWTIGQLGPKASDLAPSLLRIALDGRSHQDLRSAAGESFASCATDDQLKELERELREGVSKKAAREVVYHVHQVKRDVTLTWFQSVLTIREAEKRAFKVNQQAIEERKRIGWSSGFVSGIVWLATIGFALAATAHCLWSPTHELVEVYPFSKPVPLLSLISVLLVTVLLMSPVLGRGAATSLAKVAAAYGDRRWFLAMLRCPILFFSCLIPVIGCMLLLKVDDPAMPLVVLLSALVLHVLISGQVHLLAEWTPLSTKSRIHHLLIWGFVGCTGIPLLALLIAFVSSTQGGSHLPRIAACMGGFSSFALLSATIAAVKSHAGRPLPVAQRASIVEAHEHWLKPSVVVLLISATVVTPLIALGLIGLDSAPMFAHTSKVQDENHYPISGDLGNVLVDVDYHTIHLEQSQLVTITKTSGDNARLLTGFGDRLDAATSVTPNSRRPSSMAVLPMGHNEIVVSGSNVNNYRFEIRPVSPIPAREVSDEILADGENRYLLCECTYDSNRRKWIGRVSLPRLTSISQRLRIRLGNVVDFSSERPVHGEYEFKLSLEESQRELLSHYRFDPPEHATATRSGISSPIGFNEEAKISLRTEVDGIPSFDFDIAADLVNVISGERLIQPDKTKLIVYLEAQSDNPKIETVNVNQSWTFKGTDPLTKRLLCETNLGGEHRAVFEVEPRSGSDRNREYEATLHGPGFVKLLDRVELNSEGSRFVDRFVVDFPQPGKYQLEIVSTSKSPIPELKIAARHLNLPIAAPEDEVWPELQIGAETTSSELLHESVENSNKAIWLRLNTDGEGRKSRKGLAIFVSSNDIDVALYEAGSEAKSREKIRTNVVRDNRGTAGYYITTNEEYKTYEVALIQKYGRPIEEDFRIYSTYWDTSDPNDLCHVWDDNPDPEMLTRPLHLSQNNNAKAKLFSYVTDAKKSTYIGVRAQYDQDLVAVLYDPATNAQIAYSDDGDGINPEIREKLAPGKYYLLVYSFGEEALQDFSISLSDPLTLPLVISPSEVLPNAISIELDLEVEIPEQDENAHRWIHVTSESNELKRNTVFLDLVHGEFVALAFDARTGERLKTHYTDDSRLLSIEDPTSEFVIGVASKSGLPLPGFRVFAARDYSATSFDNYLWKDQRPIPNQVSELTIGQPALFTRSGEKENWYAISLDSDQDVAVTWEAEDAAISSLDANVYDRETNLSISSYTSGASEHLSLKRGDYLIKINSTNDDPLPDFTYAMATQIEFPRDLSVYETFPIGFPASIGREYSVDTSQTEGELFWIRIVSDSEELSSMSVYLDIGYGEFTAALYDAESGERLSNLSEYHDFRSLSPNRPAAEYLLAIATQSGLPLSSFRIATVPEHRTSYFDEYLWSDQRPDSNEVTELVLGRLFKSSEYGDMQAWYSFELESDMKVVWTMESEQYLTATIFDQETGLAFKTIGVFDEFSQHMKQGSYLIHIDDDEGASLSSFEIAIAETPAFPDSLSVDASFADEFPVAIGSEYEVDTSQSDGELFWIRIASDSAELSTISVYLDLDYEQFTAALYDAESGERLSNPDDYHDFRSLSPNRPAGEFLLAIATRSGLPLPDFRVATVPDHRTSNFEEYLWSDLRPDSNSVSELSLGRSFVFSDSGEDQAWYSFDLEANSKIVWTMRSEGRAGRYLHATIYDRETGLALRTIYEGNAAYVEYLMQGAYLIHVEGDYGYALSSFEVAIAESIELPDRLSTSLSFPNEQSYKVGAEYVVASQEEAELAWIRLSGEGPDPSPVSVFLDIEEGRFTAALYDAETGERISSTNAFEGYRSVSSESPSSELLLAIASKSGLPLPEFRFATVKDHAATHFDEYLWKSRIPGSNEIEPLTIGEPTRYEGADETETWYSIELASKQNVVFNLTSNQSGSNQYLTAYLYDLDRHVQIWSARNGVSEPQELEQGSYLLRVVEEYRYTLEPFKLAFAKAVVLPNSISPDESFEDEVSVALGADFQVPAKSTSEVTWVRVRIDYEELTSLSAFFDLDQLLFDAALYDAKSGLRLSHTMESPKDRVLNSELQTSEVLLAIAPRSGFPLPEFGIALVANLSDPDFESYLWDHQLPISDDIDELTVGESVDFLEGSQQSHWYSIEHDAERGLMFDVHSDSRQEVVIQLYDQTNRVRVASINKYGQPELREVLRGKFLLRVSSSYDEKLRDLQVSMRDYAVLPITLGTSVDGKDIPQLMTGGELEVVKPESNELTWLRIKRESGRGANITLFLDVPEGAFETALYDAQTGERLSYTTDKPIINANQIASDILLGIVLKSSSTVEMIRIAAVTNPAAVDSGEFIWKYQLPAPSDVIDLGLGINNVVPPESTKTQWFRLRVARFQKIAIQFDSDRYLNGKLFDHRQRFEIAASSDAHTDYGKSRIELDLGAGEYLLRVSDKSFEDLYRYRVSVSTRVSARGPADLIEDEQPDMDNVVPLEIGVPAIIEEGKAQTIRWASFKTERRHTIALHVESEDAQRLVASLYALSSNKRIALSNNNAIWSVDNENVQTIYITVDPGEYLVRVCELQGDEVPAFSLLVED